MAQAEIGTMYDLNSKTDLAELGAMLSQAGYAGNDVRALMELIRQVSEQVTIGMVPSVLEKVRKISETRQLRAIAEIRAARNQLGYVSVDRAVQIIGAMFRD